VVIISQQKLRFNGHFPGKPKLVGYIGAKDDGSGGDNWSYKMCSAAVKLSNCRHQQTNIQFLQAGCPFCRPTNSVKALNGNSRQSF